MGELEYNSPPFEVEVSLSGETKQISVQPEETSDGDTYYSCSIDGHRSTQVRSGDDGKWEQLWGNLPEEQLQSIGEAIKARL